MLLPKKIRNITIFSIGKKISNWEPKVLRTQKKIMHYRISKFSHKIIGVFVVVLSSRKIQFNSQSFAINYHPSLVRHVVTSWYRTRAGWEFYSKTFRVEWVFPTKSLYGSQYLGTLFLVFLENRFPLPLRLIPKQPYFLWILMDVRLGRWLGGRVYLFTLWTMYSRLSQARTAMCLEWRGNDLKIGLRTFRVIFVLLGP